MFSSVHIVFSICPYTRWIFNIKHIQCLCVVLSDYGHSMPVAENRGVRLAHWYIINTSCNCSSKHADVFPVGLPCHYVYVHVCLYMCVFPSWVASVTLLESCVTVDSVVRFPAWYQHCGNYFIRWKCCVWQLLSMWTLHSCTHLPALACRDQRRSVQFHLDHQQSRPISSYCQGQRWVQRPPGQTSLPPSQ